MKDWPSDICHYRMCDQKKRFDFMAEGLFTVFETDDLEVQVDQAIPKFNSHVSVIDSCSLKFVKDDYTFVMKSGTRDNPKKLTINGKSMDKSAAKDYIKKNVDAKIGVEANKAGSIFTLQTKQGPIHVKCEPLKFVVKAPKAKVCKGLCGDCSDAKQKVPKNKMAFEAKEVFSGGGYKKKPETPKPTPAPTSAKTPAPTNATTPAPTNAPTPAPTNATKSAPTNGTTTASTNATTPAPTNGTTPAPTNGTTPAPTNGTTPSPTATLTNTTTAAVNKTKSRPKPAKEIEKANVVGHPVFESEAVMTKVIDACLSGQPKERMDKDPVFGGSVENCIYDKSLGPGAEDSAAANINVFLVLTEPMDEESNNTTSTSEYSNVNFNLNLIQQQIVTMTPMMIPPTQGVTYKLSYTDVDMAVATHPSLIPRTVVYELAGQPAAPIAMTPAQQQVITAMPELAAARAMSPTAPGAPSSPGAQSSPAGQSAPGAKSSPTGQSSPGNQPLSFGGQAPMGGNGAMPTPASLYSQSPLPPPAACGSEKKGSSPCKECDNKLKVNFNIEAPMIVSQ